MREQDICRRLHEYVVNSFLEEPQAAALQDSDDLLKLLDSLQLLRLVVQLEPWFGIKVEDRELTPENFGSIDRIASFVLRRLAAAASTSS
jgi:acyl carrier protein